jgi:hypothetical protein
MTPGKRAWRWSVALLAATLASLALAIIGGGHAAPCSVDVAPDLRAVETRQVTGKTRGQVGATAKRPL